MLICHLAGLLALSVTPPYISKQQKKNFARVTDLPVRVSILPQNTMNFIWRINCVNGSQC